MQNKVITAIFLYNILFIALLTTSIYAYEVSYGNYNLSNYDYKQAKTYKIPIREASGIAIDYRNNYFFIHEDSHNPSTIYVIDQNARLVNKIDLSPITNHDWEDITSDRQGTFWIIDSSKGVHSFKADINANLVENSIKSWKLPEKIKRENIESIDFQPKSNSFIVITKGNGNKVYSLNSNFSKLKYIGSIPKDLKMKPSGITHNPKTGNYFVLTFWGSKIVEFKADFSTIIGVLPLKRKALCGFQPEGIDFDSNNNLIITAEKPWYQIKGHSTLIIIPHQKNTGSLKP